MAVAGELAEFLQARNPVPCQWTVFDKNLVERVLEEHKLPKEIAKFKLPERLEIMNDFPLSTFGKVSKKSLVEMVTRHLEEERSAV